MATVSNLRFYHEPEPDFEFANWVKLISIIQIITEFLSIFHVGYILFIFIQIKVCHINLRGICYLFLCDLIIKAIFNIIILFKFITGKTFVSESIGYLIINFLQWTSQTSCYFYPMSFALERSISLIWAKNYETFFSSTLLIGLCAFPLILATYVTIHVLYLDAWIPVIYIYMVINGFQVCCWTGYLILLIVTKKSNKQIFGHSLSERFQRYENLKTKKTMLWFAICSLLSQILGTIYIQLLSNYKLFFPHWNDVNADGFFRLILDAVEAILFLILPISFTFTHSKLKEKYLSIFKCFKKQIHVSDLSIIQGPNVVHSVMGKNLACKNEKEMYFVMLTSE